MMVETACSRLGLIIHQSGWVYLQLLDGELIRACLEYNRRISGSLVYALKILYVVPVIDFSRFLK